MKILIATHNIKKRDELERILSPLSIEVVIADEIGCELHEVEENGSTFEENAFIKASSGCKDSGIPCIGDDSGLCVDALNGEPGIFSARYSGTHGNDEANIDKLLKNMENVPDNQRTAHFVCAACCVFPDGRQITARGECEGVILKERHGNGGFGYDPVFKSGDKYFGEISSSDKDNMSHRGKALKKLSEELKKYINYGE
jgi:XTP/dITP diphosphohydrolase